MCALNKSENTRSYFDTFYFRSFIFFFFKEKRGTLRKCLVHNKESVQIPKNNRKYPGMMLHNGAKLVPTSSGPYKSLVKIFFFFNVDI